MRFPAHLPALALALLLPLAAIAQTTTTTSAEEERDRSFLSDTIEGLISTEDQIIRIDGFRGALSSRASVARLSIADTDGEWLVARDLVLDWNRSALLSRRLDVERLAAGSIEILRAPRGDSPPPRPEAVPFALPELPVAVHIGAISADSITLGEALLGQQVVLRLEGNADLAAGAGEAAVTATRIDDGIGVVELRGGFSNASRVLTLDLEASEGAGGVAAVLLGIPGEPALDLAISGTGPIDDYAAELRLASDGVDRVQGQFTLRGVEGGQEYALDLQGDLAPLLAPEHRAFFGNRAALRVTALQGADGSLDLSDLHVDAPALRLEGQARLAPGGRPESFVLRGDLGLADGAPVLLPAGGDDLFVQQARLALDFDAARGDGWSAQVAVDGLRGEGFAVESLTLDGGGTITEGEEDGTAFTLDMEYAAGGLTLADPALAQAVGDVASGRIAMARNGGEPVALHAFSLTGPGVEAMLTGTLGGERLAYDLRLALQAADLGRFAALAGLDLGGAADLDIRIAGRALDRAATLNMTGGTRDLALGIDAVDPLLAGEGVISLGATRDGAGLRIDRLNARTAALAASGAANVTSDATTGRFALMLDDAARLVPGLEGRAHIGLELRDDDGGLVLQADAALPGADVTARATRAPGDDDLALHLTGSLPDLAAFAALAGVDLQGRADLAARGTAGGDGVDLALALRADDLATGIPALDPLLGPGAVLGARLTRDAAGVIRLDRLMLAAAQLRAAGTVALDAGTISADLSASLPGAEAHLAGALAGGMFEGAADLDMRDLALLTGGAVAGAANVTASGRVAASLADVELSLSGVTRDIDAGIPALAPLTAGAGTISARILRNDAGPWRIADARIATPAATLTADAESDGMAAMADATLDLADLRLLGRGLAGEGLISARVNRDADGILALDAQAGAAGAEATLSAQAEGPDPMAGLELQLEASAPDLRPLGRITGLALGGAAQARVAGHVTPADMSADLSLAATLRDLNPGSADFARVLAGEGQLSARLTRDGDGRMAVRDARITFPNLSASGQAEGMADDLNATLSARLGDIGLLAADFSGPASAEGSARLAGGVLALDASLAGPGGMSGQLTGNVTGSRPDLHATGTLPLGLINGFVEPRRLRGEAAFDLRLAGGTGLDALSGNLRVNGAEAADPELGLRLSGIGGSATLAGGRATLDLRAQVNDSGTLTASGGIGLNGALQSDLRLAARGVNLRDPELYDTSINGDISITGPLAGTARIAGRIDLGATELRIPSSDIGAFGDLPDVTHIATPPAVARTLARAGAGVSGNGSTATQGGGGGYALDLLVSAPARIFIRGRGLDAELGGSLRLGGTTANIIPSGAFELIRGRLDILQQRFDLTEGRADLQGGFIPWLHLIARTRARSGTDIAITVEGPADAPQVSFTSQPELPQDEVLSQLLFGREIASITPLQAVQLAAAVATLAGRGGGGIVDSLRMGLGVDDLDLVTGEDGSAGLRLGRYLSDNIYTDVTLGAETEVNINLDLTRDITVTGTVAADGETRLGIHFERDY